MRGEEKEEGIQTSEVAYIQNHQSWKTILEIISSNRVTDPERRALLEIAELMTMM